MRLISRSILREIGPPFLLGFAAYTFVLLLRTVLQLADFFVRRSASVFDVGALVALSIPWIVVLTLPMALLLGILVGLARLSADSELTALRSCGVRPWAIYRPVLGAAAALGLLVLGMYDAVLPRANQALERRLARVAATSIVNVVSPRTFREPRPGVTLFFDRVAEDGRSLEGVFLKLGEPEAPPNRIILARRGELALEGDRLWLDLHHSTVHEADPADPARYRTTRNALQRLLLAGDFGSATPAGASVTVDRSLRSMSLSELRSVARGLPASDPRALMARVEIQKKFAIPFACVAFAVVGIPLAEWSRRGGRGGGVALSLLILVVYYVLLSGGETAAAEGRVAPAPAIWLPNLLLVGVGLAASRWPASRRPPAAAPRPLAAGREATPPLDAARGRLRLPRFPDLIDRYVLGRFLGALLLVLGSALLLSLVVDYADKTDEIARHRPSREALVGYYRYIALSIAVQLAPFATLLAVLVGLGLLSKHNEDTAFRASGVSLPRLGAPVLVAAGLGAVLLFWVGEYVLPLAEQRQARFRNAIYGRPADYGGATADRSWYLARDGAIWHREESDPSRETLLGVTVFELDPGFDLRRRTDAREATWRDGRWTLRQGWSRGFEDPSGTISYRTFLEEAVPGDPPRAFAAARRRPEEMRFRELQRLARRLRSSGYATSNLETALQAKLAQPAMLPVMALLGIPFAFRVGRRGALAGIGVGLVLGILALVTAAFLTKLGDVGALPPFLAAWSPNVLFGLAGTYLLLRLRT